MLIEFFEHDHRQIDIVLFKAKDSSWVVYEHVGIEHEQAALSC